MRHLSEAIQLNRPLLIEAGLVDGILEQSAVILKSVTSTEQKAGIADTIKALLGEQPQPYVNGKVGVIPVVGVIGEGLSPIERIMGATDVNDISAALDAFAKMPEVQTVVFDVNSPGGTVTGVPELADKIAAYSKPTVAFAKKALSAAYWIGSAADRVVTTTSGKVGSIGVYVAVDDVSKQKAAMGVTTKVIKAGKHKAIGHPGTSMSADDEALIQESVDNTHEMFKSSVLRKRKNASLSAMEGQTLDAKQGVSAGLVTGMVPSFASLIESLNR